MKIFRKKIKTSSRKKRIPDGLWSKCRKCGHVVFHKILEENFKVCNKCNYHFPLTAWERIDLLTDKGSFHELFANLRSKDPLNFQGPKSYKEKIKSDQAKTNLKEAIITGYAKIEKKDFTLAVTDSRFIMGSMGSVMGEKIARLAEYAIEHKLPLVIASGSGGGARMYEGMFSLMQMAKTSGAIEKLKENKLPFISLLTHPTMAGVMASFAGLGDLIIAEPDALIGFTGPRVIKQTIKQDLPEGFQTSDFNLEHGLLDMVVDRRDLKTTLFRCLDYLC
jgi:acetyl-CoA carboxylase carboxyl transferase subunit beta